MKRRLPQYFAGLIIMAMGVVFIKKADIGISPLSAIPAAVANITPFTLGNTTIAFHAVCVLLIILLDRRVTVKTALILPLAVAFGYIIDLFMYLFAFGAMALWVKCLVCLAGIVFTALGIVVIVGADLMLPAPDALLREASLRFHKPLSAVKVAGDVLWVVITLAIELIASHRVVSVGVGTLVSMLLTGKLVGVFKKWFPFFETAPRQSA